MSGSQALQLPTLAPHASVETPRAMGAPGQSTGVRSGGLLTPGGYAKIPWGPAAHGGAGGTAQGVALTPATGHSLWLSPCKELQAASSTQSPLTKEE